MSKEDLIKKLEEAVIGGDEETAEGVASEVLKAGVEPIEVIEKHLVPAMKVVGEKFERGEYFLTHLMLAGEAMKVATSVLSTAMSEESKERLKREKAGTVVIGTVKGDLHDIGKNLVALMLEVNGFEVYDIGVDASPREFINKAKEVNADIIGLSALMTVTRPYQAEVINYLRELGLRDRFKVMVGGGTTSEDWAKKIGADGWAPDVTAAVTLAKKLLKRSG